MDLIQIEEIALMLLADLPTSAVEDRHATERSLSAALEGTTFGCESEGDHEWKG